MTDTQYVVNHSQVPHQEESVKNSIFLHFQTKCWTETFTLTEPLGTHIVMPTENSYTMTTFTQNSWPKANVWQTLTWQFFPVKELAPPQTSRPPQISVCWGYAGSPSFGSILLSFLLHRQGVMKLWHTLFILVHHQCSISIKEHTDWLSELSRPRLLGFSICKGCFQRVLIIKPTKDSSII